MRSKVAAAALMSLLAAPALPQTKLVETIEVRVANIDVVVRDRAGNPVTGLTKEDFELYENGVKQTVTNLYEVRRDAAAAVTATVPSSEAPAAPSPAVPLEVRQRRLLLFVDSASLHPARKKMVLAAAQKFVDRMLPEDQAMLVTWHLSVHVVTPFTSDKEELKRGIAALERYAPAGDSSNDAILQVKRNIQHIIGIIQTSRGGGNGPTAIMGWANGYQEALKQVGTYSETLLREQGRLIDALERMVANFAGVDGKKVLLFVGEHLPERPGAELYRYTYDQFAPYMGGQGNLDLQMISGVMGNNRPQQIEEFAKKASGGGVAIYAIDAAQIDSELSAAEGGEMQVDYGENFARHANTASSFQTMASITGGVAVTQTSNFDLAFDTISRDLDSYYSLGYKPAGEASAAARKIVVKMKDRAYSVRSRESLVMKSTDDQMNEKVVANLYTDASASAWPIAVRTGRPKQDGRAFLVPIEVAMPSTITLLPQEQNLVGAFTLYFVVGTGDGRSSEVMRRPRELRIPATAEPMVRAKPMTFTTAIRVSPGESLLSVAVIDQISGTTGFARTKILAR
jgi:VWFA-related protein